MSWKESDGLKYYQFEMLEFPNLIQRVYTRKGGVSPAPWASLNLGGTIGDSRRNVVENRRRIFNEIQRPVESIFDVWQVHGKKILCTSSPRALESPHEQADGIFTDSSEITLLMRFADCVPIFLFDPKRKAIGIVHAGWQGTVQKIAKEAIGVMVEKYHTDPKDIHAGIGPSICQDHYEIKEDVADRVQSSFGADASQLLHENDHKIYLDLWESNWLILDRAGVNHIQVSKQCTACNLSDWYSHRAENGITGRFAAVLALKNSGKGKNS